MSIQVQCRSCGKSLAAPDRYAGKKVKCRCGAVFVLPDAARSSAGALLDILDEELASGPAVEWPDQGAPLTAASVLSEGQLLPGPVLSRRKVRGDSVFLRRLWERKLPLAMTIVSLGLLVVFIAIYFSDGTGLYFTILPIVGMALAALGFILPLARRRGRYGAWIVPQAARIAITSGGIALTLGAILGILYWAGKSGYPLPYLIGVSVDTAFVIVYGLLGATGLCLATMVLSLLLSAAWRLVRQHGLLGAMNIIYLGSAGPLLVIFGSLFLHAAAHKPTTSGESPLFQGGGTSKYQGSGSPFDQRLPVPSKERRHYSPDQFRDRTLPERRRFRNMPGGPHFPPRNSPFPVPGRRDPMPPVRPDRGSVPPPPSPPSEF